jgi:hypothetical protein
MYLQKVISRKTFFKIIFLLKIAGSGSTICQRHGSADPDPDPDPHQNVMNPQRWLFFSSVGISSIHLKASANTALMVPYLCCL